MANNQDPKISAQNAKNAQDTAKATAETVKNQKQIRDGVEETLYLQRDYASEVQKLSKALGVNSLQTAELKKSFKDVANYAKDLANAVDDVVDGTLDLSELEAKIAKGKQAETNFNKELERSLTAMLADTGLLLGNETLIAEALADHNKLRDIQLAFAGDLTEEQQSLLDLYASQSEELQIQKEYQDDLLKRAANQQKAFGLTGDILKSSTEAMKQLGLGSLASAFNFDKASEAGKKMAAQLTNGGEKALTTAGRIKVLQASISELGKGFVKNITSFEAVAAFALKSAIEASKQTANIQKETGMSYKNAYLLKQEMSGVAIASGDAFITTDKLLKAATSLTNELGMSAQVLGNDALISVTNLEQKLGFSAKESATLVTNARLQGKNTEEVLDKNIKIVGEFNKQNKTALNVNKVLKEAANASISLQANLGFSNDKLIKAASAATKLGLSLSEVQGVADSLLNFESSIEAELEAELLTGKDINLEKERQLALAGDLEGLSKSLNNNAAIQNAFTSKNVIQQEAIAKSMGMTRDQLAKVTLQQKLNTMSAEAFKKAYGETTYESLKAQGANEKLQNILTKVLDILGSILGVFSPILDVVATLLSKWYVLYPLMGIVALNFVPAMVAGFASIGKSIAGMVTGLGGLFKGGAGGVKEKITGLFGGDKTKEVADKAGDGISKASDKTKGVTGKAGDNIKNFLKGLSAGLKSMADSKVLIGALNLIPAALGLVVMTPAIPAILALSIPGLGKAFQANMTGIAKGLSALGKALPEILLGSVAIAAFGAALIPLTYALSLLTPLVEAFGKVISEIFKGVATVVTAVADGFVKLLDSISLEKAAALTMLGLGFMSLAAGLGMFALAVAAAGITSFFAGDGIITQIEKLAAMSGPLQTTASALTQMASALMGVAAALGQIDTKKLDALNDFSTKNSISSAVGGIVSAITAPIQALGNVGGGKENNELAEIKAVLQQILSKETNIYLDATKVGTGFAMNTSKVQ